MLREVARIDHGSVAAGCREPGRARPVDHEVVYAGNFAGVQFQRSNMSQVDVSGADLRGANMSESTQEDLLGQASAAVDAETRWG
jgi:hypothetical protein